MPTRLPDTDKRLVQALKREEPDSTTIENLLGRVRRYVCEHHAPFRNQAEEIAHETVVRVVLNIEEYRGESQFFTWVCRIAVNVVLEHHRRSTMEHRRCLSFDALTSEEQMRIATDDTEDATIKQMALNEAKKQLTDAEKQALELRADGFSYKEIGQEMGGITENAARKRAMSGAAKMSEYLVEKGWIVPPKNVS